MPNNTNDMKVPILYIPISNLWSIHLFVPINF